MVAPPIVVGAWSMAVLLWQCVVECNIIYDSDETSCDSHVTTTAGIVR